MLLSFSLLSCDKNEDLKTENNEQTTNVENKTEQDGTTGEGKTESNPTDVPTEGKTESNTGNENTPVVDELSSITYLKSKGVEVIDRGTYSLDSCDYPDYGIAVAEDVASKKADKGIVICYTGIGISIAANKVKGVRCALVGSVDAAVLTR